ncbi:MAG: acyltransferase family protein [Caulobacteraceae bacterium]
MPDTAQTIPQTTPGAARRFDLDVLRVGAFGLLIFYHVGMLYVTWDFHVKSDYASHTVEPLMLLLNPWRLTLLFIISGCATRFMGEGMAAGALGKSRSLRLLLPLAFGMLVVVPPQSWAQVVETFGYSGSLLDFWPVYLSGGRPAWDIIMPTYNHLWFVIYLWIYTMLAVALWRFLPKIEAGVAKMLSGPGLWIWPIALPVAFILFVSSWAPENHVFFADPYAHLQYGSAFFLGLAIARNDAVWARLENNRWRTLIAAILGYAGFIALRQTMGDNIGLKIAAGVTREAYAWVMMAALFGFAKHHITKGSPLLTTLTEAVFPFYIVHQTTIVLVAHALKGRHWPVALEAGTIIAATVASCLAAYYIARAIPPLRLVMGLKAERPKPVIRSELQPAAQS